MNVIRTKSMLVSLGGIFYPCRGTIVGLRGLEPFTGRAFRTFITVNVNTGPMPRSGKSASFEPTQPSEPETRAPRATRQGDRKGLRTLIAVIAAAALAGVTVYLSSRLAGIPGTSGVLVVGLIAFAIALIALIPIRGGLYVVPGVMALYFAYTVYNMFFNPDSVFQLVPGEAYGYAVSSLGVGTVIGYLAQGLYSAIMKI